MNFLDWEVSPGLLNNKNECPWSAARCTWLALNPVCCVALVNWVMPVGIWSPFNFKTSWLVGRKLIEFLMEKNYDTSVSDFWPYCLVESFIHLIVVRWIRNLFWAYMYQSWRGCYVLSLGEPSNFVMCTDKGKSTKVKQFPQGCTVVDSGLESESPR